MNFKLIEVAIGLIFVYLLLSIFAMVLMEFISTFLRMRAEQLKMTIEKMLFDKKKNPEKINEFYSQPLVMFLGDEVSGWDFLNKIWSKKYCKMPSYIKNEDFYSTFLSFVNDQKFSDSVSEIENHIKTAPFSENTKTHLEYLIKKSKGDIAVFKQEIIYWFEECMDRANTWYSRKVQYILLFLGFTIAVIVNGDTIRMIDKLNNDEKLRTEMVQSASDYVKNNPDPPLRQGKTDSLNIHVREEYNNLIRDSHNLLGYESNNLTLKSWDPRTAPEDFILKIFGFLLTALAVSLGSNFWFDILKKMLNVKTLGKPTQR